MASERIAALPMYDYPELAPAHDALWSALADRLIAAGVSDPPLKLTRTLSHFETWRHPGLLLGQGCEFPLAKSFAGRVRLVATPRYAVPGCDGPRYRSAIVVRADDPAETLGDLRHRRCVVNERDSNSGMNLLRAAIAPISQRTRFFESVSLSGSRGVTAPAYVSTSYFASVPLNSEVYCERPLGRYFKRRSRSSAYLRLTLS